MSPTDHDATQQEQGIYALFCDVCRRDGEPAASNGSDTPTDPGA